MLTETHPIIRQLIRERHKAALFSIAGAASSSLAWYAVGSPIWLPILLLALAAISELDARMIKYRVRKGDYGGNAMELREVARVVFSQKETP